MCARVCLCTYISDNAPPPITTQGVAASTCTETIALVQDKDLVNAEIPEPEDSLWDLEGVEWRLINVFSVDGGKYVGAYCPEPDFLEIMLEQTRKELVVSNSTVEVAPLKSIKLWIKASQELKEIQANAETGGRRKRRRITNVPRREVNMVKKWTRPHDTNCMKCDEGGRGLQKCYGCNVTAHTECAQELNHNNILCLPNKSKRWVCNDCYFETHGGGPMEGE